MVEVGYLQQITVSVSVSPPEIFEPYLSCPDPCTVGSQINLQRRAGKFDTRTTCASDLVMSLISSFAGSEALLCWTCHIIVLILERLNSE